eukprot:TRINITY_DN11419_c0_g1_i2.p1 TRINITY_DN11419_c0_g1~~TRINITY_DN11419_c0_g1_i2.p1  ORF type:complete len:137 (+),score=13.00 TRINITY_DN11419_c0_g1_i2:62-412(+)
MCIRDRYQRRVHGIQIQKKTEVKRVEVSRTVLSSARYRLVSNLALIGLFKKRSSDLCVSSFKSMEPAEGKFRWGLPISSFMCCYSLPSFDTVSSSGEVCWRKPFINSSRIFNLSGC